MKKILYLIAAASMLHPNISLAQDTPKIPTASPTARDLYIGCSLLLRDTETTNVEEGYAPPYSAIACASVVFNAYGYSSKIKPGNEWEYCTPEGAAFQANRMNAIAAAYVDTYEELRFPEPNKQGLTMMLYMLKTAWPCSSSN